MKNFLRFMTLNAIVAACALSASAQVQPAQPNATPDADAAAKAACTDLYTKWRDNYKGDAAKQKIAYEVGKQFVTQCPSDEYLSYVQKWIPKYEAAMQGDQLQKQYDDCVKASDWKCILNSGKQLAAKDPENLTLYLNLTAAGSSSKDKTLFAESLNAAGRTIQLVEAGKADAFTPEMWKGIPFASNKAELLGFLNNLSAFYSLDTKPAEAAKYALKAVQSEGRYKKDPAGYYYLSLAYQAAEYAPQAQAYKAACEGKELNDECKMKLDTLYLVVDRIIDAHARLVSLTTDATAKAARLKEREGFYRFRNEDKIDGMNELVAGIQAKPLLLPSMQTMPTPAPAPSTTTTTPSATTSNPGTATTTPAATTTTTPAPANAAKPATTSTTTPTPKPTNGTAAKPKP
ncbi:MAG TPA: hypothetical protein VF240_06855 [Pyrinomonadaceae bacterium]